MPVNAGDGCVEQVRRWVLPRHAAHFDDFLDLLAASEDLLAQTGLDADVQRAHFHPDWALADTPADDPAHGTNRAPWPTLYLLRTADVAVAVAGHPHAEGIPARNVALLRRQAQVPR